MNAASDKTEISIADSEWLLRPATQAVFAALTATGHRARAVGGCVRDTLLATLEKGAVDDPRDGVVGEAADIDIATTSSPEETIRLAEAAGLRAVPTGLAHGTITIVSDATPYEVTTLRHDVETYGRHADVAFTNDWATDAARRDFTINALYANPDGSIFDPLNGLPDLIARRVRFVGDPHQRIREDYLRILRFFRFFARFGSGQPEMESLAACISERAGLARLSSERVGHELLRLLIAPGAPSTIRVMAENGILTEVLPVAPTLARFSRFAALETALKRKSIGAVSDLIANPAMRLAALTVAVDEDTRRLGNALRLSNEHIRILALWAESLRRRKRQSQSAGPIERLKHLRQRLYWIGKDDYKRSVLIDASLSPGTPDIGDITNDITLPQRWTPPKLPIAGHDLIALGLKPGPELGVWLCDLESDWVASDFTLTECQMKERIAKDVSASKK
jgi:poly(A) polymerase